MHVQSAPRTARDAYVSHAVFDLVDVEGQGREGAIWQVNTERKGGGVECEKGNSVKGEDSVARSQMQEGRHQK
jgi:hypothetical protein